MTRKVNQVLWAQWRQRMERQRTSGLSIVAFCRKEGVSPATFHVWKRRLRDSTSTRPLSREGQTAWRSRKQRADVTPHRRPCHSLAKPAMPTHQPDFLQLPVTAARPSPWIELTLADGTVVRLPQGNIAALITVLQVLRGEPFDLSKAESCHA